jgi:DNA-binding LytR/AlgR family response regulator
LTEKELINNINYFYCKATITTSTDSNNRNTAGFELFQKIRDKDKRVKVCFITAFEDYHNQFQELFPNLEVDCFIKNQYLVMN